MTGCGSDELGESVASTADDPRGTDDAAVLFERALDEALDGERLRAIAEARALSPAQVARAAELAGGPLPVPVWTGFLSRVVLLTAVTHVVAGVGLLLAEIWESLGQLGTVALSAAVTVAPALWARRVGLDRVAGRACLTASALLCIVFATVTQLAFPLPFSSWFLPAMVVVLTLPFAIAARTGGTSLVPLGALHVSAFLLIDEAVAGDEAAAWLMTAGLGAGAWFAWTGLARGRSWMRGPLVPRVEGSVAVLAATVAATMFVVSDARFITVDPVNGMLATTTLLVAAVTLAHRAARRRGDTFLAAAALVGVAVVGSTGLTRFMGDVIGIDYEVAVPVGGLCLVTVTAVSIWKLRGTARERGGA
jgi:hypothetical protein